jgi:hypothetical protein
MKTFTHAAARDLKQAVTLAQQAHKDGRSASFAGGGSDLLGLVKERIVRPDVIVSLKGVKGLDEVAADAGGLSIGGQITLDALSRHLVVQRQYSVLAEAAGGVATPQIRNVGTLAGNVCQRPWCWYFRNGFPCYKAGATRASLTRARTSFTPSSGVARATSCIPRTPLPRCWLSTQDSGCSAPLESGRFVPQISLSCQDRTLPGKTCWGVKTSSQPCWSPCRGRERGARITRCSTVKRGRTRWSA